MHLRALLLIVLASLGSAAACGGAPSSVTTAGPGSAGLADPTSEAIGGLKGGARAPEVIALFGEPTTKSPPVVEEATGETVSTWAWPAQGLEVRVSITADATMVTAITITAPSKLTTSRGVGIGTPRATVESTYAAYRTIGREAGEPDPSNEDRIVIGSVYGGTFFTFKDGKVSDIFVGAGAE